MARTVNESGTGGRWVRPVLFAALGGAVVYALVMGWKTWNDASDAAKATSALPGMYGLGNGAHKGLRPEFSTKDGVTAASPADPSKQDDPAELKLGYIESDDEGAAKVSWNDLAQQISAGVKKPVTAQRLDSNRRMEDVIRAGGYQILVVHAAETPYLVNNMGFVPFAVAGDGRGPDGHRMSLIVNVNSPMQGLQDIRGHVLECTQPQSITGCRAPLAYLAQTYGLRAGADFEVAYSGKPAQSIRDIAAGKMAAAAVSNDKLLAMTDKGEIAAKGYRVLYESEVIPRFAVGTMYNLKPEAAEAVKKAVLSYVGGSAAQGVKGGGGRAMRFVPVDYAKDFAIERAMDDAFESRVLASPATKAAAVN